MNGGVVDCWELQDSKRSNTKIWHLVTWQRIILIEQIIATTHWLKFWVWFDKKLEQNYIVLIFLDFITLEINKRGRGGGLDKVQEGKNKSWKLINVPSPTCIKHPRVIKIGRKNIQVNWGECKM